MNKNKRLHIEYSQSNLKLITELIIAPRACKKPVK